MSEDICKTLLLKFYGLENECKKVRNLSTSKGIVHFTNVADSEETTERLITIEETGKSQNDVGNSSRINDETNDTAFLKSPHVLTIEDLVAKSKEDLQEPISELDINCDFKSRLEDSFTKATAKMTDLPTRNDSNKLATCLNVSSASIIPKPKTLWRQKAHLLKENIDCPTNLTSKYNGVFLDLNCMGITDFPVNILRYANNLQMLYLNENNLKNIPDELFIVLNKLKWLDVRNNQLTSLPTTLKGHESLETLLLQGNNIKKLPLELGLVPNLKHLQTAYNPLVFPPRQILESGCLNIVHFLRQEWNRHHEDEQIGLQRVSYNDKVDKKPSTIICYQPAEKYLQRNHKYPNPNTLKSSVRVKSWNYKPTSRCNSASLDITYHQKLLWKTLARKMLTKQQDQLQKLLDKNVLTEWKYCYRTLKEEKTSSSSNCLKDPPFALHNEDLQREIHRPKTMKTFEYKYDAKNFYKNCEHLQNRLKALGDVKSIAEMTPRSKQLAIRAEVDGINHLHKSINDLKLCVDLITPEF